MDSVERAKVLLRESHRADALAKQVADWHCASKLREYVQAMELQATDLEGDAHSEAIEWIVWARKECQRIDPLNRPIRMPEGSEATREALARFLRGPLCPDGLVIPRNLVRYDEESH